MTYPTDIPAFRDALMAYEPAEDHAAAIYAAQAKPSPVVQAVDTFNALREAPDLAPAGVALLVGAAFLISAGGGWHGLAIEAATVLATRAGELT
jgi:hypothetical protein